MGGRTTGGETARLLAGTVLISFILAFSRWGTNIGIAPLYISDVLIALAFFHRFAAHRSRLLSAARPERAGRPSALFLLFLLFVFIRAIASLGQAPILELLRDAVPFLYGVLALLAARSFADSSAADRSLTLRWIKVSLTIHLVWVTLVSVTGQSAGFDVLGALGSAPLFEIRPDIDVALVSVLAGLALRGFMLRQRRFANAAVLIVSFAFVFLFTSTRAGQISLIVALVVSFALTFVASKKATNRQLLMIATVPLLIALAAVVIPQTQAGTRLISSVAPSLLSAESMSANAQGTTRARELTWTTVVEWTNDEPQRALFGSGFGNNFLVEAGAAQYLEGTTYTDVRSPHNWFVGIYARLGLIGFLLASTWVGQLVYIIVRRRETIGSNELLSFAALVIVTVLPVATFGVVLESPFGAIPFFWAAGLLMSGARGRATGEIQVTPALETASRRPRWAR